MNLMNHAIAFWLAVAGLCHAGKLTFVEPSKELDAAADVTTLTADFDFTNQTDKPVTIVKSDPGCSCVSVQISDGKLRYEPGESGKIRAKFDMANFSGSVEKAIALWLDNDGPENPSMVLKLKVNIPVLVALEPKTLKWDVNGKADPQIIDIKMMEGETIHVKSLSSSSKSFGYELKTLEDGKHYQMLVTPFDLSNAGMAVFRVETDCKMEKHRLLNAFAVVRRPAVAKP